MNFTRRLFVPAGLLVLTVAIGGCVSAGSVQGTRTQPSNEFACVGAADFNKCRIQNDKYSLAPAARPGRR